MRVGRSIVVPYHAGGAPGDAGAARRRGAVTRHVRHATWSERFMADDATLLKLEAPADEAPTTRAQAVAVSADGRTASVATAEDDAAPDDAALDLAPTTTAGEAEVPITIEGRWAYFPVFTSIEPAAGEGGKRGQMNYKGYSVPLVVADVARGAPNPFESTYTLPPIATDHHHEMKDGQLFHTHGKGGAHRHV